MNNQVYKTEEGRKIVEDLYRGVLDDHTEQHFEQIFISTTQARTHVLKFGDTSKPPLVMVHGSVSNSAVWLGIVSDFTEHFCVYCVDIPGEPGLSEPARCPLESDAPNNWLTSLLDGLNIKKASFLTISLGSWYALNFAVKNPERVKALSMITTSGIVPAKSSFIFKAILYMMLGRTGQKLLNKAIYYRTEVPDEILEFQAAVSGYFNPVTERIPIFTDEMLMNITSPVQYFGGDHDVLLDSVKTAERIRKLIFRPEIHILEETGHVIIDQFSCARNFLVSHIN